MTNEISIDLGYGNCKVMYLDKIAKFPTAICYASGMNVEIGEENVYEFEGEKYYVGKDAADAEAFATTDYKFLEKFAPLLIFHILSKFEASNFKEPIIVNTGLAIADWNKREEFIERISNITVNDKTISITPRIIPQGAGSAMDWVYHSNNNEYPDNLVVVDIGFYTINLIAFNNGKPVRKNMKTYPGHGVSSIVKPFTSFMENKFSISFSEQEVISIFIKGEFKYNGIEQEDVKEKISELKSQFVKKLFQSVLVNDKKLLAMADTVLISGGGAYLLQDIAFPPNVKWVDSPYEFSNCRGYSLNGRV